MIANNAILTQHIDDNQVTADQIAAATITTTQIAANTIATSNVADNAIDGTKIASNSILTRHIDDDQVTGDQLADAITVVTSVTVPTLAASGDLSVDVAGDITLDADGGDVKVSDGGTHIGSLSNSSSDFIISSAVSDKDIKFQCNDGGSNVIAMHFDGGNHGQMVVEASARIGQQALTSSSNSVAWNASNASNAYHVTTENTTFAAPSNALEGAIIQVEIAQGGTPRTIAWNTVFEFAASTAPTVTATANKTDIFTFRYNGSVWQEIGRVQNLAQT